MVAFRMHALPSAVVGSYDDDDDSVLLLGDDEIEVVKHDHRQQQNKSKPRFSKKWRHLLTRRSMLLLTSSKHRLLLDDYQDTTALLSEDEHSMMHSSSSGSSSSSAQPQIVMEQEDKIDIVWPDETILMNSQEHHNKRKLQHLISLQQIKSRMGKSLQRVRTMRLRRSGFVDALDHADEEEISFQDDGVGLYAYPNDAVEAVMRDHNQKSSAWDINMCHNAFSHDLTEVDPANDPAMTPTRKQSFVVSYDEWDCAQLILQDEESNDGDDEEEEIDEESLFLHLPSSKDNEGVEVPYNSAFFHGYLNGDDDSSDDEELFLNPPANQGFEVITRHDQGHSIMTPDAEDPDLMEILSSASSSSDVAPRKKKLLHQPLGATFSHPSAGSSSRHPGQIYIQRSSSSERPLGISSGHPSWNSKQRHGSALEEASDVWSKIHSPELDGNVTDPPSPTKIQTCETDWSQGLGWSATVDDSDGESELTVSDVCFTENLDCLFGGAPTPIAAFTMKPRIEGGPLSRSNNVDEECPSDENEEPSNQRRSSMFGCSPDVVEDLLRNTFYHVPERQERPQCNCIKCSVQGMYRNLNGGL